MNIDSKMEEEFKLDGDYNDGEYVDEKKIDKPSPIRIYLYLYLYFI